DSPEPTYGFAVTGTVDSSSYVANSGARPGDALILTKPLGIGIITTAIKREKCPAHLAREAIATMTALNDVAGAALLANGASAATDVTGFGLLGHLREMCLASGTGAVVHLSDVPMLEGADHLLDLGMWAGGSQRNLESVRPFVRSTVDESGLKLLADAQTSGGLLVSLGPDDVDGYVREVSGAAVIGEITSGPGITVSP
ncbi:MAG TPA: selenide, water dikinase SelD, partial [Acidimicrobiia bacterium]